MNINEQANFIWSIADLLRGDFKQSEYGKVILPFTVLRRFDCVLAPSKAKILEANKTLTVSNKRPIFKRMTGHDYYNISQFDFEKLMDDSNAIEANLRDYINGFSEDVREIMDNFEIFGVIDKLSRANLLYLVVQRFAEIDMSDTQIDNLEMGYMFEELIRRFSEQSNETAGEHFTPREVIELMVEVLLDPDMDVIATTDGKVITILDPACGTGGMLSVAQNKMQALNSTTKVIPFGQELNPETYATCRSDMILKGNTNSRIVLGNSFNEDGFKTQTFDYMLSNPPFGVEWKKVEKGTIGYIGDIDVRIDTGPYSWSHESINRELFEDYIRRDERNAHLFTPEVRETEQPQITTEPVAFYPGEKNNLPYDIVVERLRVEEPEHDLPAQTVSTDREPDFEEVLDGNPVSIRIDGEWRTFPNTAAAEEAMYEESKAEIRRNAQNFHITDDNLGMGGAKAKYQANINAIKLLKSLEADGRQAIPEQQEVLSRYVGWGGLADAFDPTKENWRNEYAELKELLTPEEYEAARASTLNAHYTSPTVIKAIYEAVGNMGFQTGNILEPSMGVGNFFGLLPEEMRNSRLYGVELDSITGRIAQQLYPKADITVAGFETTDRRDFFDLAIGNVPFGQYQVNDRAYNKLGLPTARPVTPRSFLRSMKVRSRSIKRQRSFLMTRGFKNSPPSRVCRPNTPR